MRKARCASLGQTPSRGLFPGASQALPLRVERLLLYLNRDTWVGDRGVELEKIVRAAWAQRVEVLMVHENDPGRKGCEFGEFFTTTPQSLIDEGSHACHHM